MTDGRPAAQVVELVTAELGERARRDAPFGARTTTRVGGAATVVVEPRSTADLVAVGRAVAGTGLPVTVLGRGSNVLVADDPVPNVVVVIAEGLADISVDPSTARVRAGAGVALPVLARRTAAAGLSGLEWGVGVPGTVGGAVRMNAGGHGSDVAASLVAVETVDLADGTCRRRPAATLGLGYRCSTLSPTEVVVTAELALSPGDPVAAAAELGEIVRWRRAHQPGGNNSGSVFTNPAGDSAGRLVDAAGCKGLRIGSAEVSTKHANFIQADPGGLAGDVVAVIAAVRDVVAARHGVQLVPEVRLAGFDPAVAGDLDAVAIGTVIGSPG